jgi:hypothetical protein
MVFKRINILNDSVDFQQWQSGSSACMPVNKKNPQNDEHPELKSRILFYQKISTSAC